MNEKNPNEVDGKESTYESEKENEGLSETTALETEDESVIYFNQKIVEVEKELDQVVERIIV